MKQQPREEGTQKKIELIQRQHPAVSANNTISLSLSFSHFTEKGNEKVLFFWQTASCKTLLCPPKWYNNNNKRQQQSQVKLVVGRASRVGRFTGQKWVIVWATNVPMDAGRGTVNCGANAGDNGRIGAAAAVAVHLQLAAADGRWRGGLLLGGIGRLSSL